MQLAFTAPSDSEAAFRKDLYLAAVKSPAEAASVKMTEVNSANYFEASNSSTDALSGVVNEITGHGRDAKPHLFLIS